MIPKFHPTSMGCVRLFLNKHTPNLCNIWTSRIRRGVWEVPGRVDQKGTFPPNKCKDTFSCKWQKTNPNKFEHRGEILGLFYWNARDRVELWLKSAAEVIHQGASFSTCFSMRRNWWQTELWSYPTSLRSIVESRLFPHISARNFSQGMF